MGLFGNSCITVNFRWLSSLKFEYLQNIKSKLNSVKRFEFSIKFGVKSCVKCLFFLKNLGNNFGQNGHFWRKSGMRLKTVSTQWLSCTLIKIRFSETRINLASNNGALFWNLEKIKAENIRTYILIPFKLEIEPRTIHQELEKAVRAHAPCLKTIYNLVSEFKKKKCSLA